MSFTLDPANLAWPEPDPWTVNGQPEAVADGYRRLAPLVRTRPPKHVLADEVQALRLSLGEGIQVKPPLQTPEAAAERIVDAIVRELAAILPTHTLGAPHILRMHRILAEAVGSRDRATRVQVVRALGEGEDAPGPGWRERLATVWSELGLSERREAEVAVELNEHVLGGVDAIAEQPAAATGAAQ